MTIRELIYFNKIRKIKQIHKDILEINTIIFSKTKSIMSERTFVESILNDKPINIIIKSNNLDDLICKNKLYLHILKLLQDYKLTNNIVIRYSIQDNIRNANILSLDI